MKISEKIEEPVWQNIAMAILVKVIVGVAIFHFMEITVKLNGMPCFKVHS